MKQEHKCLIWEKTEIIDLPFYPFDYERDVVAQMINESAKYIKYIKNGKFRLSSEEKEVNSRRFFFYRTDTLIGVDISILETPFQSYLDELYFVLKMYPMVFINSHIDKIKTITLQSYCLNHYYILPVFDSIPFLDKAATKRYSEVNVEKLIKGEIKKLNINDFSKADNRISEDDLKNRFPQFNILENGDITFEPQVTWIGVTDNNLEQLLNYLFNNNILEFKVSEVTKQYGIENTTLLKYIQESMLFYSTDNENVVFRLLRKNIYWGFVCNLANQFEQEMIERDAICYELAVEQSIGTVKKVTEKIYHKIGKLFEKRDSFSYKLFSILKRQIEIDPNTFVIVVDNGNMDEIVSMLEGMDIKDRVLKILDYFGQAVTFPYVRYDILEKKNVVVVIDVINTGKLIESVIDVLENLNCEHITIFSYIVNENFRFDQLTTNKKIRGVYLTEKELYNVEEILQKEYKKRFEEDIDLNFKMLWGDIGRNILLTKSLPNTFYNNKEKMEERCDYNFNLNDNINKHSYIYQKVKKALKEVDVVFIKKEYLDFIKLVEEINNAEMMGKSHIERISEEDVNLCKLNDNYCDKNAMIIMPISYVEGNIINISRFMKGNSIKYWKYLCLVDCELYSLEDDDIIKHDDTNVSIIFHSKLKKYVALLNNPQL